MKKAFSVALAAVYCVGLCGCAAGGAGLVWTILLLVAGIVLLAFGALRVYQYMGYRKRRQKAGKRVRPLDMFTVIIGAVAVLLLRQIKLKNAETG